MATSARGIDTPILDTANPCPIYIRDTPLNNA